MPALYMLLALVACNGCRDKTTAQADLPEETAKAEKPKGKGGGGPMMVVQDSTKVGGEGPAPSRVVWGLEIGGSTAEQVDGWLKDKGLECSGGTPTDKGQVIHTCRTGLTPALLSDRTIGGTVDQIVLVRPEAGPLAQVSVTRTYPAIEGAITDYNATRAAIEKTLGKASATKEIAGPSAFEGSLARFNTSWGFEDLTVTVTANKSLGGVISVSERWQAP